MSRRSGLSAPPSPGRIAALAEPAAHAIKPPKMTAPKVASVPAPKMTAPKMPVSKIAAPKAPALSLPKPKAQTERLRAPAFNRPERIRSMVEPKVPHPHRNLGGYLHAPKVKL